MPNHFSKINKRFLKFIAIIVVIIIIMTFHLWPIHACDAFTLSACWCALQSILAAGACSMQYAALQKSTSIFMSPYSSKNDIEKAGEDALLVIYGCMASTSLSSAHVAKFQMKVMTSAGYVPPEKLPPTNDAAAFHSHRTYHQVQGWCGNNISPEDWGWIASSTGLVPIKMTQPAAPECLLKIIRCNCGGKCSNKACTCCKNGLKCTPACGQCKGITCMNGPQVESHDDDDDNDDRNEL